MPDLKSDELIYGKYEIIDIYIQTIKIYSIKISVGHSELKYFNNVDIYTYIKYSYFNLLLYYTNIISRKIFI